MKQQTLTSSFKQKEMDEVIKIVNEIKSGNIKPIYFLMGEEPYYIDKLSDYIEEKVLSEEEKGFNQTVLYGRDVTIEDIICRYLNDFSTDLTCDNT